MKIMSLMTHPHVDAADVLSLLLGAPENTSAASYINSHSSRTHNRPGREDNAE